MNLGKMLADFFDLINVNSGALQILLTIVGFLVVTKNQLIEEKYERRLNNMKKTNDALSADRNSFMNSALELYKRRYRNEAGCDEFARQGGHLVYKNGWVNCKNRDGEFFNLIEFVPEIVGNYPSTQYKIRPNRLLPDKRESYADNVKFHLSKPMFDLPLYALNTVKIDEATLRPVITVNLGTYFDFYNTCEYLGFESAYAYRIKGKKQYNIRTMPRRFRQIELFDTKNRFPGIGINNLTIIHNIINDEDNDDPTKKESFFLLHKRSNKVAEGMGNYHVVPAGSYQPLKEYIVREDTDSDHFAETMKNTVLREFGEELLDYEEFLDLNTSELLQALDDMLHPVFLGLGFEPLNTKTEVLTALVIDLDDIQQRKLFNNRTKKSEFTKLFGGNNGYEGDVFLRPLTTAMLTQYENDSRSTSSMKEIMRIVNMPENHKIFGVRHSAVHVSPGS
jgi:hypothetical protein